MRAALACLLPALARGALPPLPAYPGLRLRYETDFEGPALDTSVFTAVDHFVQTPYAQVCYMADDVSVRDSLLVLTTRARGVDCVFHATGESKGYSFTSGWVDTHGKLAVADGMVEVSSRFPPAVERIWPAAWVIAAANNRDGLTGPSTCWPLTTELDIYESTGGLGRADACASVHHGVACNVDLGNAYGCVPHPADGSFHTWAVRWDAAAGYATWYLDGVPFHGSVAADAPVPSSVAFVVNTALAYFAGEGAPGVDAVGVEHAVDWVRFWEKA